MAVKRTGGKPPAIPAYVTQWVGKRVAAPCTDGPRNGYVTSVRRELCDGGSILYAHVAIDDGPLWIGNASMLTILADRETTHGELDG